jgi:hypothetical protein
MPRVSATIGHWANLPSHACVVYFEDDLVGTPDLISGLVAEMTEGLGLSADLQISTKRNQLQWSKFASKKLEAAIGGDSPSISFLVGEPSNVRLGARVVLRRNPGLGPTSDTPPHAWLAAEGARWPEARFAEVARAWFRVAATRGTPLSGGAFASTHMRNAKVEVSLEYESFEAESRDATYEQLRKEPHGLNAWEKLRRFYPITLLGPKLASRTSDDALREAGALEVEKVGASLIVDVTPTLVETWSKPYLDATAKLRALAWPWMFQHPLDKPGR